MNVYIAIKIIILSIKNILMFNHFVFTRVLQMSNFMYAVMNADIPVIYVGVGIHFYVLFLIRNSVQRAVW